MTLELTSLVFEDDGLAADRTTLREGVPTDAAVEGMRAMRGHLLPNGQLVGKYQR